MTIDWLILLIFSHEGGGACGISYDIMFPCDISYFLTLMSCSEDGAERLTAAP